ncbi:MAG: anhydro-N-acetylmuramic acid kinase [Gammaproteobacteria bacterium]
MPEPSHYIGLISGTSVDGIDCVLVDFKNDQPALIDTHSHPFPDSLRSRILKLCEGEGFTLSELGQTHIELGKLFAEATLALIKQAGVTKDQIHGIGSHGQTIWHEPTGANPFTMQVGDPNTIAQLTGITTVADMRGRDMAAGGQGAPLAPLLHREVFATPTVDRAIVNIGGISNITILPRSGPCLAFDTGPGNVLMDYWVNKHQQTPFDRDGAWAASGQFRFELLNLLLQEPYFEQEPPKSTGRELFNGPWLESRLQELGQDLNPEDVQATLLMFTAMTLIRDLGNHTAPQEVYVCGGGAHNKALMHEIGNIADFSVGTTNELGIDPDWVEAMAFAWMAKETLAGNEIDTTLITGATSPVILGGIYRA